MLKQEAEFANFKFEQAEAIVAKKDAEIEEMNQEVDEMDERLHKERQTYKDTLWQYLHDITKVQSNRNDMHLKWNATKMACIKENSRHVIERILFSIHVIGTGKMVAQKVA